MLDKNPLAEALIFDIDGTLADTMSVHYNAWLEVGNRRGFVLPRELYYSLAGIPTAKIVLILNERLGLSLNPDEIVEEKEAGFLAHAHEIRPILPVIDVVRRYHGLIPMSLGTGGRKDMAELTIKAVGLEGYFDIMVAAEDVMNHKPFPDTFLLCAEKMGCDPSVCQVFEDADLGIEAAGRAGMMVTDIRPFLSAD